MVPVASTQASTELNPSSSDLDRGKSTEETNNVNIDGGGNIKYITYSSEHQLAWIASLMKKDLSEPYSVYTYRYFLNTWPDLCWLAIYGDECIGAILCKQDNHKNKAIRGYIGMLAVDTKHRGRGIGSELVIRAVQVMKKHDCEEVVLETETSNLAAQHLYRNLGFVRDKLLPRYYLNGADAWRLKLWLRTPNNSMQCPTTTVK